MTQPITLHNATLYHGDCLKQMRTLAAESVDAIVTDPPYGLSFMNRHWDYDVPSVEVWREALRVLKPGGHLLSFSSARTYHRMVVAIEDAGFEVRDQLMWVYGSGFPKSLDVSKALDRMAGAEREVVGLSPHSANRTAGSWQQGDSDTGIAAGNEGNRIITAPATEAAQRWAGWGTALKPAHEPICLARKPLIGTVADNVLAHGTGALNVEGCRVAGEPVPVFDTVGGRKFEQTHTQPDRRTQQVGMQTSGRWPANLIHDGSKEVVGLFPETGPNSGICAPGGNRMNANTYAQDAYTQQMQRTEWRGPTETGPGSAARFFYTAKAHASDRDEGLAGFDRQRTGAMTATLNGSMLTGAGNERQTTRRNHHPTVKPTDLMRYLCRLITPPGGLILDPYMGSGSTGKGAVLEGFCFIGIEREAEYLDIAVARIRHAQQQPDLFHEALT